jgi:5-methylcytosine-specific restriction endonuclease McrA
MKHCSWCRTDKDESEFHLITHWYSKKKVLRGHCKMCERERVGKYNKANRAKANARNSKYYYANKAKCHAHKAAYRARKLSQACGCCTVEDIAAMYEIRPADMEIDHIVPLSKGGLHCLSNLQFLPPSVNRSWGGKLKEV